MLFSTWKLLDGTCFVARFERSISSDVRLREMNERVEIMEYLKSRTGVPIPNILHIETSDSARGPGILMDRCPGVTA